MNPDKWLKKIIEYAFYALLIIVPLILTPYNYELFEFNKMLTVYFFTLVIGAAWVSRMIVGHQLLIKRTPFDLPFFLFLTSQIISTIWSLDSYTSLWGYYSRFHGGLMSTICYLILFYAFVTNMSGKAKKSLLVILSTATIVSLYGILERLGIDKHLWVQDVQNRIFSTLGQPNWLAAYLLTLIPLTLAFASKNAKYYLLTAIYLLAIYFTRSRSGFLGVGTAVGLYFLFKRFSLKVVGVVAGLGLLALVIAQSQFNLLGSRVPFDDSAPAIYSGGSSSSQIREVVWRGALDIWKAYPVFGSGVETFAYSYYNFRPVEHNLLSEWDFLYNKAHNEFLNFLATSGAFGLISYSLIIFWFTSRAKKSPELVAGFLGLSVSNFFGFSVVPVGLFFFLFPALSLVGKDDSIEIKVKNKQYYFIGNKEAIAITIVFLIACWFSFRLISWWQADKLFNYGRNYLTANQVELGYNYLVEAVSRKPNEPLFRSDLGEAAAKLAVVYDQAPKSASNSAQLTAARDQLINQAVAESDLVLEQNKVHLNFYKSRAKIFLLLNTIEGQYLNQALETVIQAIELAPTDAKLHYNLGLLYQQLNQTELAKQALEETIELKPNYEAARFSLGSLYQQLDQPDLAREQYQYILQFLNPENQQVKDELQKL